MYKGWSNYETWLANLHYGEDLDSSFSELAEQIDNGRPVTTPSELANFTREALFSAVSRSLEGECPYKGMSDLFFASFLRIDFYDLARSHARDYVQFNAMTWQL